MNITPEAVYTEADGITDELMSGVLSIIPSGKNILKSMLYLVCVNMNIREY